MNNRKRFRGLALLLSLVLMLGMAFVTPAVSNAATAALSGASISEYIVEGSTPEISGTAVADATISWIWAGILPMDYNYDTNNVRYSETTAHPYASSYNITNLTSKLNFSSLKPGKYQLSIEGNSASGYLSFGVLTFEVVSKQAIASSDEKGQNGDDDLPKTCTVYFNALGGNVSQESKEVTVGEPYGKLPTPTRKGYDFIAWAEGRNADKYYSATTIVTNTSDHTLYAIWEKQETEVVVPVTSTVVNNVDNSTNTTTVDNSTTIINDTSTSISVVGDGNTIQNTQQIANDNSGLTTNASFSNFVKKNNYAPGRFGDVRAGAWYEENVGKAYELGLVKGDSDTSFNPGGNVTLAESIAFAARIHSIYLDDNADFTQGTPWYQVYVDYAVANGIIGANDYSNYNAPATRAQFAAIMAKALPAEALAAINNVSVIPDVASSSPFASAIYSLYNAGILTGNDAAGTFAPDSYITRGEVATIVARMALTEMRKSVDFSGNTSAAPADTTPANSGANTSSATANTDNTPSASTTPTVSTEPAAWLADMNYFDMTGTWYIWDSSSTLQNPGKDNLENEYENGIISKSNQYNSSRPGEIVYQLGGEYSRLTGVLYQPFSFRSDHEEIQYTVYADNQKLWTGAMSGGNDPVPFGINIAGATKLKIVADGYWAYGRLGNVALWK